MWFRKTPSFPVLQLSKDTPAPHITKSLSRRKACANASRRYYPPRESLCTGLGKAAAAREWGSEPQVLYEIKEFSGSQTPLQLRSPAGTGASLRVSVNQRTENDIMRKEQADSQRSGPGPSLLAARPPSPGSAGPGTGSAPRRSRCAAPSEGRRT